MWFDQGPAAKKEKRYQTGLAKKDGGAHVSAGLQVITAGYAIGPECLSWAHITRMERRRKEMEKAKAGVLGRFFLKEKVEHVHRKGRDPHAGKWNNLDLKVMIQWYKRDGDGAMAKNKEGLLLRNRDTRGRVMPGSYVPFTHHFVAATFNPMASDSRYRVNTEMNLNAKNFATAVLAPVPKTQSLEPAAAPIARTITVAAETVHVEIILFWELLTIFKYSFSQYLREFVYLTIYSLQILQWQKYRCERCYARGAVKHKFLFSNLFCNNHYFKTIIIKTSQKVSPNTELNVDTVCGRSCSRSCSRHHRSC
jgi:hypothetical protein